MNKLKRMKPVRLLPGGNVAVSTEEAHSLGHRVSSHDAIADMAALDELPPLVRQAINESLFEWSAVTVRRALDTIAQRFPFSPPERHAVDLVLWLAGEEERMLGELEARRQADPE